MGNQQAEIDDSLRRFIQGQRMFFVATAPLDAFGHVNVSPKGLDTFRILGPKRVAYLDHVGSGSETIAHAKENGRIVLIWCALGREEGPGRPSRISGLEECGEHRRSAGGDVDRCRRGPGGLSLAVSRSPSGP
jgi:hypothetical protein